VCPAASSVSTQARPVHPPAPTTAITGMVLNYRRNAVICTMLADASRRRRACRRCQLAGGWRHINAPSGCVDCLQHNNFQSLTTFASLLVHRNYEGASMNNPSLHGAPGMAASAICTPPGKQVLQ